jgi:hypothetical protein
MDQNQYIATVSADVVEWPRLSQQVRLERKQAGYSFHVLDSAGRERGIFYNLFMAETFCERHGFETIEGRPILRLSGPSPGSFPGRCG